MNIEPVKMQQNRSDISLMRVIATMGIVFIHTCSVLTGNAEIFGMTAEQNTFFTCGRELFAAMLPLFFMITGVLLLRKEKEITIKICLTKYVKRMLLALFVFGVPFSMMIRIAETKAFSLELIWLSVMDVITGNSFAHLWYVYMIIGVYLILPMLKLYTDHTSHEQQRYLLVVLFLCNFLFPTIEALTDFHINFETPITSIAVYYVLLGKYLDDSSRSYSKVICFFVTVVAALGIIWAAMDLTYTWSGLLGYNSPLLMLLSVTLFLIFKGTAVSERNQSICWKLDRLCFGVYLIHPAVIQFVYRALGLTPVKFGEAWGAATLLFYIGFVIASFAGAWMMSLIPPLKKYVL